MGVLLQRRQKDPTCCLCCHVRTGTIFIGMIYLVLQMMAMVYLGYFFVYGSPENPDMEIHVIDDEEQRVNSDLSVALVITFCMFLVTCMMLSGAISHRASYLLPFFCLQLFDFVLSCLTAIGWFSNYPDNDQTQSFPYNQEWLKSTLQQWGVEDSQMSNQWLVLICILSFLTAMTVKAYCIACVWACYKYILSRENEQQITHTEDTEALLGPPAYSTVIKTPPDVPTPPPYQP